MKLLFVLLGKVDHLPNTAVGLVEEFDIHLLHCFDALDHQIFFEFLLLRLFPPFLLFSFHLQLPLSLLSFEFFYKSDCFMVGNGDCFLNF